MASRIALVDDDQHIITSVSIMLNQKVLMLIPIAMVNKP